MRMHIWTVCAGTLIAASTAQAAVTSASEAGFAVENSVDIKADAKRVYALPATPGHWWNGEHSYSGDAANLSLEPRAGGCFCERILVPSGSPGTVEHARVIYAAPDRQLRLSGGLGPLQAEAVTGALNFDIAPANHGFVSR